MYTLFSTGEGGMNLLPNFQKEEDLTGVGCWERGMTFFGRGVAVYLENKLTSQIFNDEISL